jgi:hypothetical protein
VAISLVLSGTWTQAGNVTAKVPVLAYQSRIAKEEKEGLPDFFFFFFFFFSEKNVLGSAG